MANRETFSSRWGLILAGLGLAVGTGNLWRFPRIAAQNGGAAFLIPWVIFLFMWSLPLMIAEFGIGRGTRRGVIGSFAKLIGPRYAWMGGFIAVTTIMVLFYYTVVTGWALKYFIVAVTGGIEGSPDAYWTAYSHSIWQPVFFHLISVGIGAFIIQRGVVRGIERANRVLIPVLFLLLICANALEHIVLLMKLARLLFQVYRSTFHKDLVLKCLHKMYVSNTAGFAL